MYVSYIVVGIGVDPVADLSNTVQGSKHQQNALLVDPRNERSGMSNLLVIGNRHFSLLVARCNDNGAPGLKPGCF